MLLLLVCALLSAEEYQTVVTGTRMPRPLSDAPIATTVIPLSEIDRSPTLLTDDLLRTQPTVQTFRRSSSITADPTSQGLSLRGIGPSGVSRAVLFIDGVPYNDGYGSWVYWRMLPRLGMDRIEIVPGAASAQYGSGALGGVVQIFTRPILGTVVDANADVGTQDTLHGAARVATANNWLGASLEVEALRSSGYPVITPAARGPIDQQAPSANVTANGRVEAKLADSVRALVSGGYFDETESSGTPLSGTHVQLAHLVLGLDWDAFGAWQARAFGRLERFVQTRTAVDETRNSEVLKASQSIFSDDAGGSLVWNSKAWRGLGLHLVSAGADVREIAASLKSQQLGGVYLQDSWKFFPSLEALGALRVDGWHNGNRSAAAVSPKIGLHFDALSWASIRASVYRAFRAPTLNELYRPFQVGTILTLANSALGPETLWGGDLGIETHPVRGFTARATGFASWLDAPIVNVSLPDGTRQRQNLGGARIVGLEASADCKFARWFLVSVAYSLIDARVTAGAATLIGKQLPQDPAHRFTASISFSNREWVTAMVQVRVLSGSFEDDLNTLPIPAVALVDASVSRALGGGVEVFAAIQNMLNATYLVGRAGIDTIGPPFQFRAGLRLRGVPS